MQAVDVTISVVGAGRLAWSLIPNLREAGAMPQQLISRDAEQLAVYAKKWDIPSISTELADVQAVDMIILAVPDAAILPLSQKLMPYLQDEQILVHTSGSTELTILTELWPLSGVLYPMQTMTRDKVVPFAKVPIFLEGSQTVLQKLEALAEKMSERVFVMDSKARMRIHLGAVWACNFPNLLWQICEKVMPDGNGLDIGLYKSLMQETLDKVLEYGPREAQTGPAIRGDIPTLYKHLAAMEGLSEQQALYKQLSRLINPNLDL
ncbi:MAG: DUF2520 domain-containing protein [Bacteroidota bacterium]